MSDISVKLTVYVTTDGEYYDHDTSELGRYVEGWIRGGIQVPDSGIEIEHDDCPQP